MYGAVAIDLNGNIIEEEAPYAYYKLNSSLTAPGTGADINKIKYDSSNTARRYYLRSCGATSSTASTGQTVNTSKVFVVNPTGNITNMPVNQTTALTTASFLVPCCCIV